jgi:hypothetical protein
MSISTVFEILSGNHFQSGVQANAVSEDIIVLYVGLGGDS